MNFSSRPPYISKLIHILTSFAYLFTLLGPSLATATENINIDENQTTVNVPGQIYLNQAAQDSEQNFNELLEKFNQDLSSLSVTSLEGDTVPKFLIKETIEGTFPNQKKYLDINFETPRGFWSFFDVDITDGKTQHIQEYFKASDGSLSAYLDFIIDPGQKFLTIHNMKVPSSGGTFDFEGYTVKFGDLENFHFATVSSLDAALYVIADNIHLDYTGLRTKVLFISALQSFAFGSSHGEIRKASLSMGGNNLSQEYSFYNDSGTYAEITKTFIVSAPHIDFDFGQIHCETLVNLPPSLWQVIFDSKWPKESHTFFGIQDFTVRAAQIYVKNKWWLVAKNCQIQAELTRLHLFFDEAYVRYGYESEVPTSIHPIVSHGTVQYAYEKMRTSDSSPLNCYGYGTRNCVDGDLARAIFTTLIEEDPKLETYYPLPSFLVNFSEKGTAEDQYGKIEIYTPFQGPYTIRLPGFGDDQPSGGHQGDPFGFSRTLLRGYHGSTAQKFSQLRLDQNIKIAVHKSEARSQKNNARFYQGINSRLESSSFDPNNTNLVLVHDSQTRTSQTDSFFGEKGDSPERSARENVEAPQTAFNPGDLRSARGLWDDLAQQDGLSQDDSDLRGYVYGERLGRSFERDVFVPRSRSYGQPSQENVEAPQTAFNPGDLRSARGLWDDLAQQDGLSQDDSDLGGYVYGERLGRSFERDVFVPRSRSYSPPRLWDTTFETTTDSLMENIQNCLAAKERFSFDTFNIDDIAPAFGGLAITAVIVVNDVLDISTLGLWSAVMDGMEIFAQGARTYVRRGARFVSDDQRFSQNLGDGVYVILSLGGSKGLKQVQTVRKVGDKVKAFSRVRKINNRMPINHQYAGKVYPLEKLPLALQQKYPHSVPFTGMGHPDFTRYAKVKVDIKVTGNRPVDISIANRAMGYKNTPIDYTWHHHHNGTTMQLIPSDLHKAIRHTGGVAKTKGK